MSARSFRKRRPRDARPYVAVTLVILAACSSNKGTAVRATTATFADSADQVFHGVQAPFESDGVRRGTLYADTMYVMNDQTRFDFLNGHVDFNTDMGKPEGSMRADRGRFDQRTEILEGWGNVVVKSVDGRSLKSPHVVYDARRDRISSDTTFELVAEGRVTTGIGFSTNSKMTERNCSKDCKVRAEVAIPK